MPCCYKPIVVPRLHYIAPRGSSFGTWQISCFVAYVFEELSCGYQVDFESAVIATQLEVRAWLLRHG
jgi:hypothetical protein